MGNPFAAETELLILRILKHKPAGMYGLELVRGQAQEGNHLCSVGAIGGEGVRAFAREARCRRPWTSPSQVQVDR